MDSRAGFLAMPDISDVPEIERHSMLRDLDIPGVRDRNLNPEAGPRLAVLAFRLQGMVEFPELGITKAELDKMVEAMRVEMMDEGELLESGFTQDELGEVSSLLLKIEDETQDRHVNTFELQQLVWLIRDQQLKRGITLGQIEVIADKITAFYRERGFILAKAYIPKQAVRDGIVNLTMQLGVLGEVNIENNALYNQQQLKNVFDDMIAKPVTSRQIEERLYLIGDYPGISINGFFEPGTQLGDTRLSIKVNSEKPYTGNIRLDNHGTEETGKQRLYADVYVNNPLAIADFLQLGLLTAVSPGNTQYYLLRYNTNVYSPRLNIDISSSTSQFVLDQNVSSSVGFDLSGETTQFSISTQYKIKRSRASNHNIGLKQETIKSNIAMGSINNDYLNDKIRNNSMFYNFDILDEGNKILHQGTVNYNSGEFAYGNEQWQDKNYKLLTADYTYLSFFTIPFLDARTRIIFRTAAQLSDASLSSLNQFSLAGATRARGFVANQFSADSAVHIGMEWLFNAPELFDFEVFGKTRFSQITQPFILADVAYGVNKSTFINENHESATLADIGLGMRFVYSNDFNGNLQFAFPVNHKFTHSDITNIDDGMKVVFDFQYSFL